MGRNKNKEISAELFKKIKPLLPIFIPSAKGGRPRVSDEMALNGILFVLRTGIPWEELELPRRFSWPPAPHTREATLIHPERQ